MSEEKTYKRGMTTVWSDGDKIVVENPVGTAYINQNISDLFGVGEWKKIQENSYVEEKALGRNKRGYKLVSGYIPKVVKNEFKKEPNSLLDKYFEE